MKTERCPALTKTLIFAFYGTILSAGHLNRVSPAVNDIKLDKTKQCSIISVASG